MSYTYSTYTRNNENIVFNRYYKSLFLLAIFDLFTKSVSFCSNAPASPILKISSYTELFTPSTTSVSPEAITFRHFAKSNHLVFAPIALLEKIFRTQPLWVRQFVSLNVARLLTPAHRLLLQINAHAGRVDPHVRFSAHRCGLCIDYLHWWHHPLLTHRVTNHEFWTSNFDAIAVD